LNSEKVFVVHGRDEKIRKSMFAFLRSIGIEPLEWSKIVKATGNPNPYVGEVLDKGFSIAKAVVILMTPDDEARLRKELRKESEQKFETELTPQPRQNVLVEAGMALGKFPDETIVVQIGPLRQISDLLGKHVIRLDNSAEQRNELAQRLETAGCKVDLSGRDWFSEGNFELDDNAMDSDSTIKDEIPSTPLEQNYSGLTGGIQQLVDVGFFDKPQVLKDIADRLKENGYHYPRSSIHTSLFSGFIRNRKSLTRIRDEGSWKYITRK